MVICGFIGMLAMFYEISFPVDIATKQMSSSGDQNFNKVVGARKHDASGGHM